MTPEQVEVMARMRSGAVNVAGFIARARVRLRRRLLLRLRG